MQRKHVSSVAPEGVHHGPASGTTRRRPGLSPSQRRWPLISLGCQPGTPSSTKTG